MRTMKILAPLATVVAGGALAVGSGATYTSVSATTISSATSGPLTQSNSRSRAAIFDASNLQPGDVVRGGLTITNTASVPARFRLVETESTNAFGRSLSMVITDTTARRVIYAGTFGGLADGALTDLGLMGPGAATDYSFTVELDRRATNRAQGRTAAAAFEWSSVEADAATSDE
ncbi:hypothetical protein [Aeromicrobium yanjiei]|nr:hypothetical protein [Aeromicrobium yanjiei]